MPLEVLVQMLTEAEQQAQGEQGEPAMAAAQPTPEPPRGSQGSAGRSADPEATQPLEEGEGADTAAHGGCSQPTEGLQLAPAAVPAEVARPAASAAPPLPGAAGGPSPAGEGACVDPFQLYMQAKPVLEGSGLPGGACLL